MIRSNIPSITNAAERAIAEAVTRTGKQIEAEAKRRARVDTGEMRDKIAWEQGGRFDGAVVARAEHTIFNEYGTVNMSAQPMLGPAALAAEQPFREAIADAYRQR